MKIIANTREERVVGELQEPQHRAALTDGLRVHGTDRVARKVRQALGR
jgi:hypothetical protein